MSIQAIAGVAYDRRNPKNPSRVAAERMELHRVGRESAQVPSPNQDAARQVNTSLETLKRYIPTELLALYLPFVSITQDQYGKEATTFLHWTYIGFLVATPVAVWLVYVARTAEAGQTWTLRTLPRFEAGLALGSIRGMGGVRSRSVSWTAMVA